MGYMSIQLLVDHHNPLTLVRQYENFCNIKPMNYVSIQQIFTSCLMLEETLRYKCFLKFYVDVECTAIMMNKM